ncbi:MAG: tetratricopeptide repeat protein [Phycisphaerales bacterium]|nr:tetratricopeptide repeat protein [Phycisphaerales bacterium]
MEHRSNTQNHLRHWVTRSGNARIFGVLIGLVALLAAGVAGYAIWTMTTESSEVVPEDRSGIGNPQSQGMAHTESIEEILGAVQVYVRNQQFAEATAVLENAVAQYTSDQELRFALGDLYLHQKGFEKAYDQYVAGIEIGPQNSIAEFTAGTIANMLGRVELSEMHYQSSMMLDQTNPDTPIFLAAIQIKINQLDEAKKNLAIAGRLAPDRARIFAMRSEIAMRENKAVIALEQIRRAREIEPRDLGWILQEARVLKRNHDPEGAITLLTALPEEELLSIDAAQILAECYGMVGRAGDAANRLIDVALLNPNDPDLAFDVAQWLERAGERESAIAWANKAVDLGHLRASDWIASLP